MSAKIISVANMKGGVGKTTVVVSLAETLATISRGDILSRVLVIDLDALANASFSLAGDSVLLELIQCGRTIDAFLEDRIVFDRERSLSDIVRRHLGALPRGDGNGGGVALIASSPELRIVEREIVVYLSRRGLDMKQIERRVADVLIDDLALLRGQFDYIIFDCAPGISSLTESALRASDLVIVPTVPDFICNLGLEAFCKTVQLSDPAVGVDSRPPWVLANRVRHTPSQTLILEEMRAESAAEDAGFMMFRTELPDRQEMEEITSWGGERLPYDTKYRGAVATVLEQLVNEV
jgi:chromosome partitioning protein